MNLKEILQEEEDISSTLEEAKHTSTLEYIRHWVEYTPEEKLIKKGHGHWVYGHREVVGVDDNDSHVVHHKDHNKHNNRKSNLEIVTRAEHCKIDPNARKNFKCSVSGCNKPHYAHGLCFKHYMQKYRNKKFGNYNKEKNYSTQDR